MDISPITAKEFSLFKDFIYGQVGIHLSDNKQPLVSGRLSKRLKHHGMARYQDYFQLITDPKQVQEKQIAIDLLTTNETHFFREPKHFNFMLEKILPNRVKGRPFRVWSAACSSGEEPYTIAMLLAEHLKDQPWEIIASDVSTKVLAQARAGCYPIERAAEIPPLYLKKYCLKGTGDAADKLLISRELRQRVQFSAINLTRPFPAMGEFDIIFLRNVMIYFDVATKKQISQQMLPLLRAGSYFMISHSESLNGVNDAYTAVIPSVYQKT